MKKKDRLEIRLSQTEFEILDRQAKELGLNRSEFIPKFFRGLTFAHY